MVFAERLKALRKAKDMSQGEIEKRTGLLRCYISRVENGHTVPAIETLEKLARAMEMPLYQLFYDGDEKPPASKKPASAKEWGHSGKDSRRFERLRRLLSKTSPRDQEYLLALAQRMAQRKTG